MKKWFFFLLPVVIASSCFPEDVAIRTEKRVEVSGRVLQFNSSNPIPQVPVATYGMLGEQRTTRDSHKLGFGRTAVTGNFKFISLDITNGRFALSVNPTSEDSYKEDYATYHFLGAADGPKTVESLGDIPLPLVLDFNFSILNTSGTQEELIYSITYFGNELFFRLGETGIDLESPEDFGDENIYTISGRHNNTRDTFTELIETVEGSVLILNYSLGEEEPQELEIPITFEMSDYVFEY